MLQDQRGPGGPQDSSEGSLGLVAEHGEANAEKQQG